MARFGSRKVCQIRIPAGRFRQAADQRWKDARCLHLNGRFEGAIYLCGYVLECFLKSLLCERRREKAIEEKEAKELGHNLHELLDRCGLLGALTQNPDRRLAFERINTGWSPDIRYSGRAIDKASSLTFLQDTLGVRKWLEQQN